MSARGKKKKTLLDPALVARISTLALRARYVAEGVLSGMHKSPRHGSSVEFSEHKEYAPGDELRHIDWRVFGRTDRYYVKRFEDEKSVRGVMVLDASGSMGYRSRPSSPRRAELTKFEYASVLAAALSYLLLRQQDAAGLALGRRRVETYLPPRARGGHFSVLAGALEEATTAGAADLGELLEDLLEKAPRRALVLIFSDLLDDPDSLAGGLARLRRGGYEPAVFHLLDPDEIDFPFEGLVVFEGLEGEEERLGDPERMRREYLERMGRHRARVKSLCDELGVEYRFVDTSLPPEEPLTGFLLARRGGG